MLSKGLVCLQHLLDSCDQFLRGNIWSTVTLESRKLNDIHKILFNARVLNNRQLE